MNITALSLLRGLLSSIYPNFQMLKFYSPDSYRYFKFARFSPPLARAGGWKKVKSSKFHPLTPASGGKCSVQTKILGKNFNTSLVKLNLTALSLLGGQNNLRRVD